MPIRHFYDHFLKGMSTKEVIGLNLSGQHELGMTLILDNSEPVIRRRLVPDKWSMFEHYAHLVRYQHIFLQRVDRILSRKDPAIERYSAETDPAFPEWLQMDREDLTQQLVEDRFGVLIQFRELPPAALKRKGIHPVYGPLSLLDWHEFFVLHEAHHLHAMWKLLMKSRGAGN